MKSWFSVSMLTCNPLSSGLSVFISIALAPRFCRIWSKVCGHFISWDCSCGGVLANKLFFSGWVFFFCTFPQNFVYNLNTVSDCWRSQGLSRSALRPHFTPFLLRKRKSPAVTALPSPLSPKPLSCYSVTKGTQGHCPSLGPVRVNTKHMGPKGFEFQINKRI